MNKIDLLIIDWHKPFWDVDHENRLFDMTYDWHQYVQNNLFWIVDQKRIIDIL